MEAGEQKYGVTTVKIELFDKSLQIQVRGQLERGDRPIDLCW